MLNVKDAVKVLVKELRRLYCPIEAFAFPTLLSSDIHHLMTSMLSTLSTSRSLLSKIPRHNVLVTRRVVSQSRTLASIVPTPAEPTEHGETSAQKESGALRPHLGIQVNPNHGLYAFFHKKTNADATVEYVTIEPTTAEDDSGEYIRLSKLQRCCLNMYHSRPLLACE